MARLVLVAVWGLMLPFSVVGQDRAAATQQCYATSRECMEACKNLLNLKCLTDCGRPRKACLDAASQLPTLDEIARRRAHERFQNSPISSETITSAIIAGAYDPAKPGGWGGEENDILRRLGKTPTASLVLGLKGLISTFGEDVAKAALSRALSDKAKAGILRDMVEREALIETLYIKYANAYASGRMTEADRSETERRIGDLYNRNAHRLEIISGATIVDVGHVDGTVTARHMLRLIREKITDNRQREAAKQLHKVLQQTDSYYKDLTPEQIKNRIRQLN